MRFRQTALPALALFASASAAQGGIISYQYDRPAFLGQVVSPIEIGFEAGEGFALGSEVTSIAGGAVVVSSEGEGGGGGIDLYNGSQALTGLDGDGLNHQAPITLDFGAGAYAVGFDILDLAGAGSELAVIRLSFDALPDLFYTLAGSSSSPAVITAEFFGVVSSEAITGVTVWSQDGFLEPTPRANLIDNLVVQPVPEPGTLALAAAGAGLLAWRRREV